MGLQNLNLHQKCQIGREKVPLSWICDYYFGMEMWSGLGFNLLLSILADSTSTALPWQGRLYINFDDKMLLAYQFLENERKSSRHVCWYIWHGKLVFVSLYCYPQELQHCPVALKVEQRWQEISDESHVASGFELRVQTYHVDWIWLSLYIFDRTVQHIYAGAGADVLWRNVCFSWLLVRTETCIIHPMSCKPCFVYNAGVGGGRRI